MANIDINRRAIIEAHVEACRDAVLQNAVELGRWLIRAKDEGIVPHGEWEEWVRTHAGMSERSAQRLMQVAREIPEGSPLERLGVAKIEALLMLPAGEREQAAEEMDAASMSSREVWREARERVGKTPNKSGKLDPGETMRIAKAAKEEVSGLKRDLDRLQGMFDDAITQRDKAEADLETANSMVKTLEQQLRIQSTRTVTVEKIHDDYADLKKRLSAAEKEADRLADELDRAKLGAENTMETSPTSRILSAIGAFLAEAGTMPDMLHRNPKLMNDEDWKLVESRVRLIDEWVMRMRGANWNA